MTFWRDDPELQDEVQRALRKSSVPLPGFAWVLNALDECPNQDWSDSEVREGNIQDIVEMAEREARKKGTLAEKPGVVSRDYVPSSAGQSYATMSAMLEPLKATRLRYWGIDKPPFHRSHDGSQAAAEWFQYQQDVDRASYPKGQPGKVTLTIDILATDLKQTLDAFTASQSRNSDTNAAGHLRSKAAGLLTVAKDSIAYLEDSTTGTIELFSYNPRFDWIDLRGVVQDRSNSLVLAIPGETLGNLLADIKWLIRKAGWWSEQDTFKALLYGSTPSAEVRVSRNRRASNGEHTVQMTLEVVAPSQVNEVAEKYAEELEYLGFNPKSFTIQQNALFQLINSHPEANWPQRFSVWQEWCETHPELRNYTEWRGLRSSYLSAKRRADSGWGEP